MVIKLSLFFISTLALCACTNNTNSNNTTRSTSTRAGIKGKVKSITEQIRNNYTFAGYRDTSEENSTTKFNEKGDETEIDNFDVDGKIRDRMMFKYNLDYKKTERYDPDNVDGVKVSYKYDERGNLIEDSSFKKNTLFLRRTTRKYDDKNRLIEINYYNSDDSLLVKDIPEYNDSNEIIQETILNADGGLLRKYSIRHSDYDSQGNWQISKAYGNNTIVKTTNRTISYY